MQVRKKQSREVAQMCKIRCLLIVVVVGILGALGLGLLDSGALGSGGLDAKVLGGGMLDSSGLKSFENPQGLFGLWGANFWALNFLAGYVGFALVSVANFFALKRRVSAGLDALDGVEKEERKKQKYSRFVLGVQVFGSWVRILAYILLGLGLFGLMRGGIFVFWSYGAGIFTCLSVVIVLQFFNLKRQ